MAAGLDLKTAKMLQWISSSVDKPGLKSLYQNAKIRGAADVERAALQRLWALDGVNHEDPLHRDFAVMLAAYEHVLMLKHGKNVPASRTRQKLKSKGVAQCLEDWALGGQETAGFKQLIELGFPQYTGEAVVLRHSNRFPIHVLEAAQTRLAEHGITEAVALARE